METVLAWAGEVGEGLDDLTTEQRKEVLQTVVDEAVIDRDNNVNVTLVIPVDESLAIASPVSSPADGRGNRGGGRGLGRRSRLRGNDGKRGVRLAG